MNRCAWGITTLGSQTDESKRCSEVVQGTKLRVYWHMTQTYRRVRPKSWIMGWVFGTRVKKVV